MIPRAEILFTLAMAEKGLRSETPPEVMAELCRVYLRYTWLRSSPPTEWPAVIYASGDLDEAGFDAAVDAAMNRTESE